MKKALCLLLFITVTVSACSTAPEPEREPLAVLAPETEMTIVPTTVRVDEFLSENENFTSDYDGDECYNITPDFVAENSDFAVFKYTMSTESFILYGGHVYSIGTCFGGYGITGMALADINRDGQYELYYTFSWGSGIPRSQIGYFDPADQEITVFDYSLMNYEMMLTVNESGDLCVNSADPDFNSWVDFSIKARDLMGTIVLDQDKIVLDMF